MSELAGLPLHYLIGAEGNPRGEPGVLTVAGYDVTRKPALGVAAKYCNLLDEKNCRRFGPYLRQSGTAAEYDEGLIDPAGPGFTANLEEQFERARSQGFAYVELDNPDSYKIADVLRALDLAADYGLQVLAKNPALVDPGMEAFLSHSNVCGAIVEKGAGTPESLQRLRLKVGRPELPVWFVGFGRAGKTWTSHIAPAARRYGMGVTLSTRGEYRDALDLVRPHVPAIS